MGSASQGTYTDAARRLAVRSVYAFTSGVAAGTRLVAKGVTALTADNSDREQVHSLRFAQLEWTAAASTTDTHGSGSGAALGSGSSERLPVLLIGLSTGFQVWRMDGTNPAELVSRRDGPAKLLEVLPEPRAAEAAEGEDVLRDDRPLLAVVPAPEVSLLQPIPQQHPPQGRNLEAGTLGSGSQHHQLHQQRERETERQQQHSVLMYSLRSHGYVRTLSFSGEVLGVQASSRVLVVALRGQLQAFDARTLHHTFSCLTYTPPTQLVAPAQAQAGRSGSSRQRQQQPRQFLTDGLTSSSSSVSIGSEGSSQQQQGRSAASPPHGATAPLQTSAAALAPFALGPRWLAYAADTPVPPTSSQAIAQRLPLSRRDSAGSSSAGGGNPGASAALNAEGGLQLGGSSGGIGGGVGGSAGSHTNGLTKAAVADAALQVATKGGQQLQAGLTAVGSASFRYLNQQYRGWRQGAQQQQDIDALEADAAVAGTVVVRDAASRIPVAHFRAHTSPLAALHFSPGGTLLATASVAGHSINLFRIVPPAPHTPAGAELTSMDSGTGGNTGHAVWLYRLYRGVTPAAICGIAISPDAAWVAVSSGRGTTHLFHTPAAATCAASQPSISHGQPQVQGQQAQQGSAAAEGTGVVGQPPKTLPVARASKPGLLTGSIAGAATSAAKNLYSGRNAGAAPIAAAFMAVGPSSPRSAAPSLDGSGSGGACGSSLYVLTSVGLLTRHLLRPPAPAQQALAGSSAGAGAVGSGTALAHGGGAGRAAANGGGGTVVPLGQEGERSAGAPSGAPAVLEEADRWDVARHGSWPEREELLPGVLAADRAAGHTPDALITGGVSNSGVGDASAGATAHQQQLWVAQAESGPLAVPGAAAMPLWQDPQFQFYEMQPQAQADAQQGGQHSSASSGAAEFEAVHAAAAYRTESLGLAGPTGDALAARMAAATLQGASGAAPAAGWL